MGTVPTAPVRGVGLTLLLQHGLPVWIHAVRSCVSPSPSPITIATARSLSPDDRHASVSMAHGCRADVLPLAQHAEVARLLAGLVLSARPVRRDRPAHDGEYV